MRQPIDHFTSPDFWPLYNHLPTHIRRIADKCFSLLKSNPKHPSLHLKKIGEIWSVRVGIHYRAVGIDAPSEEGGILWIWIGSHAKYDRLIRQR